MTKKLPLEDMPLEQGNQDIKGKVQELQEYLSNIRDVREWKRAEAVRLRLLSISYQEIQQRLGVSFSFIAKSQKKYIARGIQGFKLEYQGSKSYLTPQQKAEIKEWLSLPERRNISELERYLIAEYDVVFKSRESYYQLLRDSELSWQKSNKENPRKKPELIKKRTKEIASMLNQLRPQIESGKLVVYAVDECHLQGDDIISYLWGERKNREIVQVGNDRDRQTYYGAFNLWTKKFIVHRYGAGNGKNTVQFIREIKAHHPQAKLLLIWDGATYHRGEEMQQLLVEYNYGKQPEDWLITCCLFAPYAPEENPVEAIWLQVKNFIRRFHYLCSSFAVVKRLFQFFFDYHLFNSPNLKKYDAFVQMI